MSEHTFRYLPGSEVAPVAVGVGHRFDDLGGMRMEFFAPDPSGAAEFVVFQAVYVDPTAMIEVARAIEARYSPPQ